MRFEVRFQGLRRLDLLSCSFRNSDDRMCKVMSGAKTLVANMCEVNWHMSYMSQLLVKECRQPGGSIFGGSNHAMTCVVVYQACLARYLIDNGRPTGNFRASIPRAGGQRHNAQSEQETKTGLKPATSATTESVRKRPPRQGQRQIQGSTPGPILYQSHTDTEETMFALAKLCL